jgi:putative ABC transport system permease protein
VTSAGWLRRTDAWLGTLVRLYPADFRSEMGHEIVDAYRERATFALERGGVRALLGVWFAALGDSVRNGIGERLRPSIAWRRRGNWGRDAERAVRRLVRAPVFTLTMVGTLAVGLGGFAVVYALVHSVLIAPLPYERPNDLYFVWRDYSWVSLDRGWAAGTDVLALDTAGGPIQNVVALRRRTSTLGRSGADDPREIAVMVSTPDLFDVLGARAMLGRTFAPDEGGTGRPAVAVLGYELWRDRFGADSGIIGTDVRFDETPYTVIGVMGRDFHFVRHSSIGPPEAADAYVTFDYDLRETNAHQGAFAALLRARPGATPEAVTTAVGRVGAEVDRTEFQSKGLRLYPVGVKEDLVAPVRPALIVLGVTGGFLVLVLMINLATLLLVRATQREREFAVSRALGASRGALASATMLEGGLLGLSGSVVGVVLAVWGTGVLLRLAPADLPRRESIVVSGEVALVVLAVGVVLGLLAGAVPALWAARANLSALLAQAAVRGGGGHGRVRRGLVVVQVALSLVLLSTGGLVARSFEQLLRADPGFAPTGVLTFRVPMSVQRFPQESDAIAMHDRLRDELSRIPGVTAVGAVSSLPLAANTDQTDVRFPGAPGNTGDADHDAPLVDYLTTHGDYFGAIGARLVAGRAFSPVRPGGAREVIIDQSLAGTFFPGADALGAILRIGTDSFTVVGIVRQPHQYDVYDVGRPQIFVRNADATQPTLSWAVRTTREPMDLVPEVRAVLRRADPGLALADARPTEELMRESLRQQRVSAAMIGGFAAGALLLAGMGLFGVVSESVARRRKEVAVRLALGADHGRVLRLVLREGAVLVLVGLIVGAPGIYFVGRVVRGMLVGLSPYDPLTIAAVAVGLAMVTLIACYVPARRVIGIDPARALREE